MRPLVLLHASLLLVVGLPQPTPRGVARGVLLAFQETAFDARGYPEALRPHAVLTETRCTKCHSITRVVKKTAYDGEEWAECVERMRTKEKSGISPSDAEKITNFLSAWANPSANKTPSASVAETRELTLAPHVFACVEKVRISKEQLLPASVRLAERTVLVRRVEGVKGSFRVDVELEASKVADTLTLTEDTEGQTTGHQLELRRWSLGPHTFRELLALYAAGPAEPRPEITLAVVVTRSTRPPRAP